MNIYIYKFKIKVKFMLFIKLLLKSIIFKHLQSFNNLKVIIINLYQLSMIINL
jgi:hypothetical protein